MTAQEFIEGLKRLQLKTPRPATFNQKCVNSEYTNYTGGLKNCYLSFGDADEEDCYYTRWCFRNKDCCDIDNVEDSQLTYDCIDCTHSYNSNFCQDCENITDCNFCYNCIGCENCFGCVNLRQAKYCYYNEQLTKEAYEKKMQDRTKNNTVLETERAKFLEFQKKFPRVYMHQRQTENCIGDYILRSKNCLRCFDTCDCQDCLYLLSAYDLKDCLDTNCIAGKGSELNYELMSGWYTARTNFCYFCWHSHDLEYCEFCFNSHDLFGCVGLNHKEYHILNKPYSKEEYFVKVKEIKEALKQENLYGRFFLPSPYPYEDTLAHLFYG